VRAGEINNDAVRFRVISQDFPNINEPIPNVGITILDFQNPGSTPPARCVGSTLTNEEGIGVCNVLPTCRLGPTRIFLDLTGLRARPIDMVVEPGGGTKLVKVAGDNQTARVGTALPLALSIAVSNNCDQPVGNQAVTWRVTQGAATLSQTSTQTDANGRASTRVTLGQVPGPVQITVTVGNQTAVFTATANVTVSGISIVSGNNQTADTGAAFAQPLVVQVLDNTNAPLGNFPVTFSVASGSASLSVTSVNTDAQGRAQTLATAGAIAGAISVTATASTFSVTFTLTSVPPGPRVQSSAFVNAASFQAGLAPCALASVSGTGLAPGVTGVVTAPSSFAGFPLVLANVSITVGGFAAPISSVINQGGREQVNFQTPCEVPEGNTSVVISVGPASTTVANVPVTRFQPGIFEYVAADNRRYAVLVRASDGSYITPQNPARRGDVLFLFATGLFQTTPATGTNRIGLPGQRVAVPVVVGINNAGVRVISADYLVGSIGTYLVQFEVPQTTQTGPYQPLALAVSPDNNTLIFGNGTFFPIQ
jgi:uncharacterized protein (TIGR03437 family)